MYATGASRFYGTDEQVQLLGTGSRAILAFYGAASSVDSRGSRYGWIGYPDSSHLIIENEYSTGSLQLKTTGASAILLSPGGTERARIESDGQFFVGKSDPTDTVEGIMMAAGGSMHICRGEAGGAIPLTVNYQAGVDGNHFIDFARSGTTIGRVEQNGTTGVSYVTSSDRRMKTIVGPIDDAVERVKALNPVRVTWNGDPARGGDRCVHRRRGSISCPRGCLWAAGRRRRRRCPGHARRGLLGAGHRHRRRPPRSAHQDRRPDGPPRRIGGRMTDTTDDDVPDEHVTDPLYGDEGDEDE